MDKQKAIRTFSGFAAAALFPLFLTGCGEKAGWSASLEKLYDPTTLTLAGLPWDSSISQVEETLKLDLGETALYQGGDTALFILPVTLTDLDASGQLYLRFQTQDGGVQQDVPLGLRSATFYLYLEDEADYERVGEAYDAFLTGCAERSENPDTRALFETMGADGPGIMAGPEDENGLAGCISTQGTQVVNTDLAETMGGSYLATIHFFAD